MKKFQQKSKPSHKPSNMNAEIRHRAELEQNKVERLHKDMDSVPKDSELDEMAATTVLDESKLPDFEMSAYVAENVPDLPRKKSKREEEKENERTIFVGNVDIKCRKRELLRLFSKYGKVETIRLRSFAPAQPEVSKREAAIRNNTHSSRTSCNAYVRFETKEMMEGALEANGMVFHSKHLRVDKAIRTDNFDRKAAVFVGNLPFECEDEELFKHFEQCGEIESIRIVRNNKFSSGKGFGYVNFKSSDAVEVALQLNGKPFKNRNLRIQRCVKKSKIPRERITNALPNEGQKIGFMKLKGDRMSLKFMKNQKKKTETHYATGKKKQKKNVTRKVQETEFSGVKTMESNEFKKVQKKRRIGKADRKKLSVAHYLVGNKLHKKKIK